MVALRSLAPADELYQGSVGISQERQPNLAVLEIMEYAYP